MRAAGAEHEASPAPRRLPSTPAAFGRAERKSDSLRIELFKARHHVFAGALYPESLHGILNKTVALLHYADLVDTGAEIAYQRFWHRVCEAEFQI